MHGHRNVRRLAQRIKGFDCAAATMVAMKEKRTGYEKGDLLPLHAIFPQVYALKQWTTPWRLVRLIQDWPAVVGTEVARLTAPAFFRRDVLWIYVQDSAWMHHFQFVKTDLLARINQYLSDTPISDLRWQLQSEQPAVPQSAPSQPCRNIDQDRERDFQQLSASIANPECREALRRLWRSFAAYST